MQMQKRYLSQEDWRQWKSRDQTVYDIHQLTAANHSQASETATH